MSKNTSQTLARLDRALTREQLRRSEALLRAIAESSPLAILVVDENADQVLYFNHLFLEILQLEHLEERLLTYDVDASELARLCPEALALPRSRPPPGAPADGAGEESPPSRIDAEVDAPPPTRPSPERTTDEVALRDGRALRRVTTAVRDRSGHDVGLLIALEDITAERLAREEERSRTERVLAFQAALLLLAEMDKGDLVSSLESIAEVDARAIEAARVGYWTLSDDRTSATCTTVYDLRTGKYGGAASISQGDAPRYMDLVLRGKSIVVHDLSTDDRLDELRADLEARGVASLLDAPVWSEGRVLGFMRHERTDRAVRWSQEEQEFAASVAEMTSVSLEASARRAAEGALKKLQEQLVLTDRMASVGTLAAGVAHEINNPLAFVIANLSYVSETIDGARDRITGAGVDLSEVEQALAEALEGADRVKRIVQSLRSFSKADGGDRRLVDVRRILDLSIRMTSNEIAHRARLETDYQPVPLVHASEAELGQVFLNILLNGVQSIEERVGKGPHPFGGRKLDGADAGVISIRSYTGEDGEAVVEIRDNGVGMTDDQQKRAFDPFYTTKPVGTGTGLGLFVSRNIVMNVGGTLTVESAAPRGCVVRICIPSPDAPTLARLSDGLLDAGDRVAGLPRRRGRILVIDDEPTIGTVIERMLRSEHEVVAICDGIEALERLRGGESYDVVLCDLLMPGLTGMELYERLKIEQPAVARKILFFTGGAFTPRAEAFLRAEKHRCIEKPFDARELRAVVRSML